MGKPDHRKSLITPVIGAVVIVGLLGGAYYVKLQADAQASVGGQDADRVVAKVTVLQVRPHTVPTVVTVRGFLEGLTEVRVHAEVAGRVVRRAVSDSQKVEAGDLLCQVDPTLYRIAVSQAQANLAAALTTQEATNSQVDASGAQLERLQAQRDNARIEFDRLERLYREGNAARIEFDRRETTLRAAEAGVRAAEAALRKARQERNVAESSVALAQAKLAESQELLARCEIVAPQSGRVDRLLVEEGEYVVAAQPVADVIRLDRLKLFVELTGRQLASLGDQVAAELIADAHPDRAYPAVLQHVAPRADPVSRKFRVELHADNSDGRLLAGMFAECRLTGGRPREIMTLPASAVVRRFGKDYCYLVAIEQEQARCHLHRISTRGLASRADQVEVVAGLQTGDRVVVESHAELRDGMPVSIAGEATE